MTIKITGKSSIVEQLLAEELKKKGFQVEMAHLHESVQEGIQEKPHYITLQVGRGVMASLKSDLKSLGIKVLHTNRLGDASDVTFQGTKEALETFINKCLPNQKSSIKLIDDEKPNLEDW